MQISKEKWKPLLFLLFEKCDGNGEKGNSLFALLKKPYCYLCEMYVLQPSISL